MPLDGFWTERKMSSVDRRLETGHGAGVLQQVGTESYVRMFNKLEHLKSGPKW